MGDWKDEIVNEGKIDNPSVVRKEWTDENGDGVVFFEDTVDLHGLVKRVTTIPNEDNVPSDYDLAIYDSDGVDILAGSGVGRSGTDPGQIILANPVFVLGPLTVAISGQMDVAGKGKVVIYIDKE